MNLYKAFASASALLDYARGNSVLQPSYISAGPKRVRRSLCELGESFAHGWKEMKEGKFANAIMVYAATIGEFHPLKPVIDNYLERWPETPVVILSGQAQYIEAIFAAYPKAAIGIPPPVAPWLYDRLFKLTSPRVLVLGEGPCLHLHFPIPLSLALPAACLRHSTPMVVVNATRHRLEVGSKLVRLENRLFGSMHKMAMRFWYVPNEIFGQWLLEAGIPQDRIVITGDLRFDGLGRLGSRSAEFTNLLDFLNGIEDPIIVAGSVNAIDEEGPVIDGWLKVREKYPGSKLIIAPRHINNSINMTQLTDYLEAKGVRYAKRSGSIDRVRQADVIVVDVFGELPHFYSIAAVAYIGRNHGVLEPLRFKVPTVVAPRQDWASEYVTFPAYKFMVDEGAIIEAKEKAELGQIFLKLIDDPSYRMSFLSNALRVADAQRGAGKKIVDHMASYVR